MAIILAVAAEMRTRNLSRKICPLRRQARGGPAVAAGIEMRKTAPMGLPRGGKKTPASVAMAAGTRQIRKNRLSAAVPREGGKVPVAKKALSRKIRNAAAIAKAEGIVPLPGRFMAAAAVPEKNQKG